MTFNFRDVLSELIIESSRYDIFMTKYTKPKKKGKYDITLKSTLTPDELFKLAATTPIKKDKPKKK